jgi:hypothetical protein
LMPLLLVDWHDRPDRSDRCYAASTSDAASAQAPHGWALLAEALS